ncbi:type I phosphomannose isomerase catalytic subunit [Mucilaginibacter sp.]|uniref:type I phosphomannose isomerase catalytic subunit n=1 Tax=Mucilaginibacter sp. TaxID=1882438 RepID=UPI003B0064B9
MSQLYPLKFKTIFKDKIWGGEKIKTVLGKDFSPLPNCGETWEVSGVKGNISVVAEGELEGKSLTDLLDEHKGDLAGNKIYEKFGSEFPLLIKFIDANDDLSIQVHPDDELGKKRHNSFGKTEMWYVMQADAGSTLISGFNQAVDEKVYVEKLESGQIMDILNKEDVSQGDIFFLPAGRVHTIGKGLLIAEIQQTSDITYRIYDFDRVDDKGNKRELHTQEALAALDYKVYPEYKSLYPHTKNEAVKAVSCQYFTTNILDFTENTSRSYADLDSFVIHVCVEGSYDLVSNQQKTAVKKGDCVLIPNAINNIQLETATGFKILETFVA